MQPEVTIAIPTYNRLELLRRALDSALSQQGASIQVVISDDGSTDSTADFLRSITDDRVCCLISAKNAGMHTNMNNCLKAAQGRYFLMLSDDDYLEPGCVEALLGPWRKYRNLVMSYGQWWYERDGVRTLQQGSGPEVESGFDYVLGCWQGQRPTIFHGALFETDRIRCLGGIPKGYAQDTLLKQRIALEGDVAYVKIPVTSYCFHSGSTTHTINLQHLIRDRASVLEMCLHVGQEKGFDAAALRQLMHLGRQQFLRDASHGLVSLFVSGASRRDVFRAAYGMRQYLKYGFMKSMACLLLVATLPRPLVASLKTHYKSSFHPGDE